MRSIFLVEVAQGNSWWYILPVQHVVELCVYIHSMYVMYVAKYICKTLEFTHVAM